MLSSYKFFSRFPCLFKYKSSKLVENQAYIKYIPVKFGSMQNPLLPNYIWFSMNSPNKSAVSVT